MNEAISIPEVFASTASKSPAPSGIKLEIIEQNTRLANGAKTLGICWALAVASIALPIVHFVLVPGLFLAGIVMGWLQFRKIWVIPQSQIACPECSKPVDVKSRPVKFPISVTCAECKSVISLTRQD